MPFVRQREEMGSHHGDKEGRQIGFSFVAFAMVDWVAGKSYLKSLKESLNNFFMSAS